MINDHLIPWLERYHCRDWSLITFCHATSIVDFDSLNWSALSEMNSNKNSSAVRSSTISRWTPLTTTQVNKQTHTFFFSWFSNLKYRGVQSSLNQYTWKVLIVLTSVAFWMDLLGIYDIFCISSKRVWLRSFHVQSNILSRQCMIDSGMW